MNGTVAPTSGNTNTTIGCVVTNAVLTQANANKLAEMAHDGYARAIEPTHTPSDGDCIFAMATGTTTTTSTTWDVVSANMSLLGVLAVNAMERAIVSACYNAESVTDSAGVTTVGAATLRAEGKTPAQPAAGNSAVEDIEAFAAAIAKVDVNYVVVAGDTVGKIAAKYGVDWKELAQFNKLANPDLIFVGQVLKIPQ